MMQLAIAHVALTSGLLHAQVAMPANISSLAQPMFTPQGQQVYLRPATASVNQPQQTVQLQLLTNKPKDGAGGGGVGGAHARAAALGKAVAPQIQGTYTAAWRGVLGSQSLRVCTILLNQLST